MTGNFRIDDALAAAARVAHLAAKIMKGDLASIKPYEGQDIKALNIEDPDWNFLNPLKRQPDKSTFYYWYYTVQLLTTEKRDKRQDDWKNNFGMWLISLTNSQLMAAIYRMIWKGSWKKSSNIIR
jgi:hypothetical protein